MEENSRLQSQLKADKHRADTLPKQFVLREFVNLFQDAGIGAMLLESQMQVMEQSAGRWVSAIVCYEHLGERVKDEIQAFSEQWTAFRDATGVTDVEIFTNPFTDPKKCLIRIDLRLLGGWNNSPIKYGLRPVLIW